MKKKIMPTIATLSIATTFLIGNSIFAFKAFANEIPNITAKSIVNKEINSNNAAISQKEAIQIASDHIVKKYGVDMNGLAICNLVSEPSQVVDVKNVNGKIVETKREYKSWYISFRTKNHVEAWNKVNELSEQEIQEFFKFKGNTSDSKKTLYEETLSPYECYGIDINSETGEIVNSYYDLVDPQDPTPKG